MLVINQFLSRQFFSFVVVGGLAAIINFCSRFFYNQWFSFSLSVVLAYLNGMVSAFVLARLFVFRKSQKPVHHAAIIFMLVNLLAVLQTWLVSMGLAYYLFPAFGVKHFVPEMAHAVGVVVPVFTSYLGHRNWTFR